MKRSVKQRRREALTAEQVRLREVRKAGEADRALWVLAGGELAWRAELNRRQAARNARTRQRTREALAQRAADAPPLALFDLDTETVA